MEPPAETQRQASLVDRLARMRLAPGGGDWRPAVALALLIAAGPGLTIVGARLLADRARGEAIALEREAAPRLAAARAGAAARVELRPLLTRPGPTGVLDALARVLPEDAQVIAASAAADGMLRVEVLTPDPDRLRLALRRDPATAALRDAGQQRGSGGLIVTLERAP